MGFKIAFCDVPTGDTEGNNHNKTGKDESNPVDNGYAKGHSAIVSVEYRYGKYQQCNGN